MNAKSMLIAAAVLATPACAVSEADVTAASAAAVSARVSLQGETYLSRDTFTVTQYRRRPDGQYAEDTITVRYRLRFIPAGVKTTKDLYGDYEYSGDGVMEYETVIDQVEEGKPELTFSDDMSYYAKRSDGNSFRLYDCDSTHVCADNERVSKLDVFTLDGVKTVKVSGLNQGNFQEQGIYLAGVKARDILFQPAPAAPEPAPLPAAMTCTSGSGDETLTLTPVAGSPTAKVELKDRSGAVLESARNDLVLKDALGHYFVVASWEGVRISLGAFGDGAAKYENEISGVVVDFAAGTCRATR